MTWKVFKKARLVCELASIQRVQTEKPSWFRQHDYDRLAREFVTKSAELVALEIAAYNKRVKI